MVMAVSAVLLSPTLTYRMGLDQGVFAYLGAEVLEGRWPYIDTWDHAFPGLMYLQAMEILLLGKSIAMFRLFDLVYQLTNVYLIYRITRALSGRAASYVAASTYVLIYQGYGWWNTAQREGFGLLFVLLGFWLYLTADRRRPVGTAVGIGIGLGLAVTIKPTLLALSALYLPLLARLNRRTVPLALAAAAALLLPALGFVVFYWLQGELVALYEACISFQTEVYVARLRGDDPLWLFWLSKLRRLGANAIGISVAFVPFLFWGQRLRERRMLYLGYLGSVYAIFAQGTFAGYHYLPGLGLGAVLIGTMFSQVVGFVFGNRELSVGSFRIGAPLLLAHGLVLAALPLYLHWQPFRDLVTLHFLERPRPDECRNRTVFSFAESWDLAEYLKSHTDPEETIQVWGHESLVYYLAERDAAGRFQTSNPFVTRGPDGEITPMQQRWRREFMRNVVDREPRYVVVVREDNWWWAPGQQTSEQLLDDFPEWKAFIEDHYALERNIGRYLVYRRLVEAPPS
jgi:hypothetical protein